MKYSALNNQKGFALILELVLVAVVAGVIAIVGYRYWQRRHSTQESQTATSNVAAPVSSQKKLTPAVAIATSNEDLIIGAAKAFDKVYNPSATALVDVEQINGIYALVNIGHIEGSGYNAVLKELKANTTWAVVDSGNGLTCNDLKNKYNLTAGCSGNEQAVNTLIEAAKEFDQKQNPGASTFITVEQVNDSYALVDVGHAIGSGYLVVLKSAGTNWSVVASGNGLLCSDLKSKYDLTFGC